MQQSILDMTSPVYDTARLTLSNLGIAGVAEAAEFAEMLGLTGYSEKYGIDAESKSGLADAAALEFRFNFSNHYIRRQNTSNVVEIACGFSPRGIMLTREGYNYIGADLEAAAGALQRVTKSYKGAPGFGTLNYKVIDVTDPDAFYGGCEEFEGPVTIVCEGLFMYLRDFETASFCEGLKRVLAKHGGCFLTPDFSMRGFHGRFFQVLLGEAEGKKRIEALSARLLSQSDADSFESLVHPDGDDTDAYRFFTEKGLRVERIPLYDPDEPDELKIFSKVSDEVRSGLLRAIGEFSGWKVTYDGTAEKAPDSSTFRLEQLVRDGRLQCRLFGRLDSVTSTQFVEQTEQAQKGARIWAAAIDMAGTEYVSSAGLRVLLQMKKAYGRVEVSNVPEGVMEIFRNTGFDTILDFV